MINLITIQSLTAFKMLMDREYLVTDDRYINKEKYGFMYNWMIEMMDKHNISRIENANYPLWAWDKYGNIKCPPKNTLKGYFAKNEDMIVKITFQKEEKDVLITDFEKYSFVLHNRYLPESRIDYLENEEYLNEHDITTRDLEAFVRRDKYQTNRNDEFFMSACEKIVILGIRLSVRRGLFYKLAFGN